MTVLVVMNGVGRFLVPDVGTGDRVDDEAEDVELHHTSCVSPFAHHNDNLNQQTFNLNQCLGSSDLQSLVLQSKKITAESYKHRGRTQRSCRKLVQQKPI